MKSLISSLFFLFLAAANVSATELPKGVSLLNCKSPAGLSFEFVEGSRDDVRVTYFNFTKDYKLADAPRYFREDFSSTYPYTNVRKKDFSSIAVYSTSNTLYDKEYYYLEFSGNILLTKTIQNVSGTARKVIIPFGVGRVAREYPEVSIQCALKFAYSNY